MAFAARVLVTGEMRPKLVHGVCAHAVRPSLRCMHACSELVFYLWRHSPTFRAPLAFLLQGGLGISGVTRVWSLSRQGKR